MEKKSNAASPDLLHPYTVQDFFSKYFETQHLHISRNQPGYFDAILSAQDIDEYLATANVSYPDINMASATDPSSPAPWLPMPQAGKQLDVAKEELFKQLASGNTLIINLLEQKLPRLNAFLCQLAEKWTVELTANAYITPPSRQGFEWHYDDHDVLVLQIEGSKQWDILPEKTFLPDKNYKSRYTTLRNDAGAETLVLQEGDSLYIPRGMYHKAAAQESTSLHLTIAINTNKRYDLIKGLLKAAIADENLRRSLIPSQNSTSDFHDTVQTLKEFSSNYFDGLLSQQHASVKNQQESFHGRFMNVVRLQSLSAESKVSSRVTQFEHRINGAFVHIRAGKKTLRFPKVAEPFLLGLLKASGKSIYELPNEGLSESQSLSITEKLLAEGWIDLL